MDDATYRVAAAELRQFIERWERLDVEKQDIAEQQKEVMAEAKARGYDTKVMKKVIALRKRDPDDIAEEEAVLDMYRNALGLAPGETLQGLKTGPHDPGDEDDEEDPVSALV